MANLTYYSFSKRSKSTKQPTGGTVIDVQLKGGTDILSPTFLLSFSGMPTFNYVHYENRYYFVKGINNVRNDLWELICEEDYLATWKSDIGSTSCEILYATGGRNDIVDKRIPLDDSLRIDRTDAAINGLTIVDTQIGCVVISVTGVGSFGTYVLQNAAQLPELLKNADLYWSTNVTDIITAVKQGCFGGMSANNLKAAIGLPFFPRTTSLGNNEQLYLGQYPCTDSGGNPINVLPITNPICKYDADITIPWHYNDWRRHTPYSNLILFLPLIGMIELPADELINDTTISVTYSVNITSGDISVSVDGMESGKRITTASGNISLSTPYGSSNIDKTKIAAALTPTIGVAGAVAAGVVSGGAAIGLSIAAGTIAGAVGLIDAAGGSSYGGGGLGGGSAHGIDKVAHLWCLSKNLTDTPSNLDPIIGKPVMKKDTISNYSGFIQTGNMQIVGNMLDSERDMINELCNGGFYYE